ncbi:MAG: hypothetical protein WBO37_13145 [Gammaproteobacteria bacterium]
MINLPVRPDNINQSLSGMMIPVCPTRNDMGRMNSAMQDATGPTEVVSGMFPFQAERMAWWLENKAPQGALNSGRGSHNLQ